MAGGLIYPRTRILSSLTEGIFKLNIFPHLDQALEKIAKIDWTAKEVAANATMHEAERILKLAQELAPISSPEDAAKRGRIPGQLRASGRVRPPNLKARYQTADIIFGGPAGSGAGQVLDVDYAYIVHEMLYAHHEVGQAKYLETAVYEEITSGRMMANIVAELRTEMGWNQ